MEAREHDMNDRAKYLRIPPWSKVTCRACPPRDNDYDVHVKVKEHRMKGSLKVYGLLFECDRELSVGSYVDIEIFLSEDLEMFKAYGRIVEVRSLGKEGLFWTKMDFKASSDEEVETIARFAGKFN